MHNFYEKPLYKPENSCAATADRHESGSPDNLYRNDREKRLFAIDVPLRTCYRSWKSANNDQNEKRP